MQKGSCSLAEKSLTTEDSEDAEVRGQGALATAGGTPELRSRDEPGQRAAFEFLGGGAQGAAVVGVGDFPELGAGIAGVDDLRMTDWNVAVDLAVNQEHGDFGGCD